MFSYNVALNGIVTFLPLNFTPSFDIRRGVARIFQRGGGVTLCQSEGTRQIVMLF